MQMLWIGIFVAVLAITGAAPPVSAADNDRDRRDSRRDSRSDSDRFGASNRENEEAWSAGDRGTERHATGTVVSLESANELKMRLNSGQEVTVNYANARKNFSRDIREGDRISVDGVVTAPNYLEARAIDDRDLGSPSALPRSRR